jgi:hypothetical protein
VAADLLVFIRMLFFFMADFVGVCPYIQKRNTNGMLLRGYIKPAIFFVTAKRLLKCIL